MFELPMQKYWELDPSKSSSEGVDSLKRITPQNTQESLTEDPHDQHPRLLYYTLGYR